MGEPWNKGAGRPHPEDCEPASVLFAQQGPGANLEAPSHCREAFWSLSAPVPCPCSQMIQSEHLHCLPTGACTAPPPRHLPRQGFGEGSVSQASSTRPDTVWRLHVCWAELDPWLVQCIPPPPWRRSPPFQFSAQPVLGWGNVPSVRTVLMWGHFRTATNCRSPCLPHTSSPRGEEMTVITSPLHSNLPSPFLLLI